MISIGVIGNGMKRSNTFFLNQQNGYKCKMKMSHAAKGTQSNA